MRATVQGFKEWAQMLLAIGGMLATVLGGAWLILQPSVDRYIQRAVDAEGLRAIVSDMRDNQAAVLSAQSEFARQLNETQESASRTAAQLASIAETLASTSRQIADMQKAAAPETRRPVLIADTGNTVCGSPPSEPGCDPVRIGGVAFLTIRVKKVHGECGAPTRRYRFINGGGVRHDFLDLGSADHVGTQLSVMADWQHVTIAQRVPADDGVVPGGGRAYVSISYPDCPAVKGWTEALGPFRIAAAE